MFIPQAQPHAESLFLFPIVFGINLIPFFDISTRKNGAAGNSIVCFAASIPCQSRHLTVRRMRTVSKSATFLATESVNSAPFKRGETEVQFFWQGIAQNSSSILRCTFLARRRAKLIANFSATMVTSLPSFSLSLSLCISLSHRMYLTHNIGSASALPIIHSFLFLDSWSLNEDMVVEDLEVYWSCFGYTRQQVVQRVWGRCEKCRECGKDGVRGVESGGRCCQ